MKRGINLRIHRGAHEIGGNCVELVSGDSRLILDLGRPLNVSLVERIPLPLVPGLGEPADDKETTIIISHPHADHYGLLQEVNPSVPVFIGAEAARLLDAALPFTSFGISADRFRTYRHREQFRVGNFSITPFLVDHSAFDAYAFLIEANGNRIVYSGDFRMHGRKENVTKQWLNAAAIKNPDMLIIEGTSLGRDEGRSVTEKALETTIADRLADAPGLVLAAFSPQNIDRLVSFYKAARRCGRQLVIDPYAAALLKAINRPSLPKPDKTHLGIFLPASMRRSLDKKGELKIVNKLYPYRVYPEMIAENPSRYVLLFRGSMIQDVERMGEVGNARLFYSQWPGYLDQPTDRLRGWCESKGINIEMHHTSGHADQADLLEAISTVAPRQILPIHTVAPEKMYSAFPNVIHAEDGRWIDCSSSA